MAPFPVPTSSPAAAVATPPQAATASSSYVGKTSASMDEERARNVAYEYLCHLEEAKNWMSACIGEELPATTELEEGIRNGVILAKLAHFFAPNVVSLKRIFDSDESRYRESGLHFRHTDNINHFLRAAKDVGLPEIFLPETTDVYDRKNVPRAIFCIHALSLYLYKLGIAPQIQDLYGKVTFTNEEISNMRSALDSYGIPMPQFRKIGGILANEMPVDEAALHAAIIAINSTLDVDGDDAHLPCLEALSNPAACLQGIDGKNANKYYIVLRSHKIQKVETAHDRSLSDSYVADAYDELLSQGEIQGHVTKVNLLVALEEVAEAAESGDARRMTDALADRALGIKSVIRKDLAESYLSEIQGAIENSEEGFLRAREIEVVVQEVNRGGSEQEKRLDAVRAVNACLTSGDPEATAEALANPALKLGQVHQSAAWLYHNELKYVKDGSGADLRHEGIQALTEFLNLIARINLAALGRNPEDVWRRLTARDVNVEDLDEARRDAYAAALLRALGARREAGGQTMLTHADIQEVVDAVNEEEVKSGMERISEEAVVFFQSRARGFLVRQRLFSMLQHYYDREALVIKTQAAVRGWLARKKYQSQIREAVAKRPRLRPPAFYRAHAKAVVAIQRAWRQYKNKLDFEALMQNREMNLPVVRKYLHLLDLRNEDFEQELLLQGLRADITKAIRLNQQLEKDVDMMDVKIGLLVRNRISVQDVVAHSRTVTYKTTLRRRETFYLLGDGNSQRRNNNDNISSSQNGQQSDNKTGTLGLKALRKESRDKLNSYQHLFYLLQTDPNYLARLVFAMPQTKTTKFLESVILTLYNFGANRREEYLLLKLFRTALEEEVERKVERLSDVVTGQPMVVKIIVSFNRNGKGQKSLREMLGPLINRVLEDKSLKVNTNPVEIYKQWVNQMEFETGKSCGMPYDVTAEAALEHEEVKKRLSRSITRLKQVATLFLTTIVKSKSKIPYGMLYMTKVLHRALRKKFPDAPEKEILKVIGNLLYYRYINGAIVAPDSCDIVDMNSPDQALNNEQRKNLGSIAKLLQFAASKKGFGEEAAHLMCLNQYIIESHERFKEFFADCCAVPELDDEFSVDPQFSEATLIAKPVIYVTLAEICDTHQLLLDHRFQVAPDESDPLHELLDDLGGEPSMCSLLGAAPSAQQSSLAHLAQTEVCLALTNKFVVPKTMTERLDVDRLFVKTKQLLMTVLPCTAEGNLLGCLKSAACQQQIELYWRLVDRKQEREQMTEDNKTMMNQTNLFPDDESPLSLEDCKRQILKNLQILERHGYVSKRDGFQAMIASLGRDIVNQKLYRTRRRKEIFRLKNTMQSLEKKRKFYEDQVSYYNTYLKQCLANLQAEGGGGASGRKKNSSKSSLLRGYQQRSGGGPHSRQQQKKLKSKQTVRYSGSKLHHKGVLLTIEGLPENQFKNVLFEFVPSESDGVFEVHARFMGVKLEHVEVDIQELLQLQYEGVSVMNMFGKARINVNLLLHLLNVKFYGRK